MALVLSIKQVVVVIVAIVVIILGIFLVFKISRITNILPLLPTPFLNERLVVKVNPESSQQGTLFLVNALYKVKEQQDLVLKIESEDYSEFLYLYDDGKHFDKKPNDGVYAGFFDSADKPVNTYNIKNEQEVLASFEIYESKCEPIIGNPGKSKINFVILPYNYEDYSEFRQDAKNLLSEEDSLPDIEPFKSNIDKFSFSITKANRDLKCKIGCHDVDTIVCCDNKNVLQEASQCNHDNILILINDNQLCGSASSYAKICSKNKLSKLVIVHELGHSFADLADEYTYSDYDIGKINSANCAEQGCEKWKSITQECIRGCTYSDLYRSSQESIMYAYVPYFNSVSKEHIKQIIEDKIKKSEQTERASPVKKSYFVDLKYVKGKIEIGDVYLKPIKTGIEVRESDYTAEIKNKQGETIFKTNLYVPEKIFPLPNSSAKPVILDEFETPVLMPYFAHAEKLDIYKNNEKIASTSLVIFSEKCGNNICDESENHVNCAIDCEMENDGFCQTTECDPDCASQEDCVKTKKIKFVVYIVMILISVFVIILILVNARKNK